MNVDVAPHFQSDKRFGRFLSKFRQLCQEIEQTSIGDQSFGALHDKLTDLHSVLKSSEYEAYHDVSDKLLVFQAFQKCFVDCTSMGVHKQATATCDALLEKLGNNALRSLPLVLGGLLTKLPQASHANQSDMRAVGVRRVLTLPQAAVVSCLPGLLAAWLPLLDPHGSGAADKAILKELDDMLVACGRRAPLSSTSPEDSSNERGTQSFIHAILNAIKHNRTLRHAALLYLSLRLAKAAPWAPPPAADSPTSPGAPTMSPTSPVTDGGALPPIPQPSTPSAATAAAAVELPLNPKTLESATQQLLQQALLVSLLDRGNENAVLRVLDTLMWCLPLHAAILTSDQRDEIMIVALPIALSNRSNVLQRFFRWIYGGAGLAQGTVYFAHVSRPIVLRALRRMLRFTSVATAVNIFIALLQRTEAADTFAAMEDDFTAELVKWFSVVGRKSLTYPAGAATPRPMGSAPAVASSPSGGALFPFQPQYYPLAPKELRDVRLFEQTPPARFVSRVERVVLDSLPESRSEFNLPALDELRHLPEFVYSTLLFVYQSPMYAQAPPSRATRHQGLPLPAGGLAPVTTPTYDTLLAGTETLRQLASLATTLAAAVATTLFRAAQRPTFTAPQREELFDEEDAAERSHEPQDAATTTTTAPRNGGGNEATSPLVPLRPVVDFLNRMAEPLVFLMSECTSRLIAATAQQTVALAEDGTASPELTTTPPASTAEPPAFPSSNAAAPRGGGGESAIEAALAAMLPPPTAFRDYLSAGLEALRQELSAIRRDNRRDSSPIPEAATPASVPAGGIELDAAQVFAAFIEGSLPRVLVASAEPYEALLHIASAGVSRHDRSASPSTATACDQAAATFEGSPHHRAARSDVAAFAHASLRDIVAHINGTVIPVLCELSASAHGDDVHPLLPLATAKALLHLADVFGSFATVREPLPRVAPGDAVASSLVSRLWTLLDDRYMAFHGDVAFVLLELAKSPWPNVRQSLQRRFAERCLNRDGAGCARFASYFQAASALFVDGAKNGAADTQFAVAPGYVSGLVSTLALRTTSMAMVGDQHPTDAGHGVFPGEELLPGGMMLAFKPLRQRHKADAFLTESVAYLDLVVVPIVRQLSCVASQDNSTSPHAQAAAGGADEVIDARFFAQLFRGLLSASPQQVTAQLLLLPGLEMAERQQLCANLSSSSQQQRLLLGGGAKGDVTATSDGSAAWGDSVGLSSPPDLRRPPIAESRPSPQINPPSSSSAAATSSQATGGSAPRFAAASVVAPSVTAMSNMWCTVLVVLQHVLRDEMGIAPNTKARTVGAWGRATSVAPPLAGPDWEQSVGPWRNAVAQSAFDVYFDPSSGGAAAAAGGSAVAAEARWHRSLDLIDTIQECVRTAGECVSFGGSGFVRDDTLLQSGVDVGTNPALAAAVMFTLGSICECAVEGLYRLIAQGPDAAMLHRPLLVLLRSALALLDERGPLYRAAAAGKAAEDASRAAAGAAPGAGGRAAGARAAAIAPSALQQQPSAVASSQAALILGVPRVSSATIVASVIALMRPGLCFAAAANTSALWARQGLLHTWCTAVIDVLPHCHYALPSAVERIQDTLGEVLRDAAQLPLCPLVLKTTSLASDAVVGMYAFLFRLYGRFVQLRQQQEAEAAATSAKAESGGIKGAAEGALSIITAPFELLARPFGAGPASRAGPAVASEPVSVVEEAVGKLKRNLRVMAETVMTCRLRTHALRAHQAIARPGSMAVSASARRLQDVCDETVNRVLQMGLSQLPSEAFAAIVYTMTLKEDGRTRLSTHSILQLALSQLGSAAAVHVPSRHVVAVESFCSSIPAFSSSAGGGAGPLSFEAATPLFHFLADYVRRNRRVSAPGGTSAAGGGGEGVQNLSPINSTLQGDSGATGASGTTGAPLAQGQNPSASTTANATVGGGGASSEEETEVRALYFLYVFVRLDPGSRCTVDLLYHLAIFGNNHFALPMAAGTAAMLLTVLQLLLQCIGDPAVWPLDFVGNPRLAVLAGMTFRALLALSPSETAFVAGAAEGVARIVFSRDLEKALRIATGARDRLALLLEGDRVMDSARARDEHHQLSLLLAMLHVTAPPRSSSSAGGGAGTGGPASALSGGGNLTMPGSSQQLAQETHTATIRLSLLELLNRDKFFRTSPQNIALGRGLFHVLSYDRVAMDKLFRHAGDIGRLAFLPGAKEGEGDTRARSLRRLSFVLLAAGWDASSRDAQPRLNSVRQLLVDSFRNWPVTPFNGTTKPDVARQCFQVFRVLIVQIAMSGSPSAAGSSAPGGGAGTGGSSGGAGGGPSSAASPMHQLSLSSLWSVMMPHMVKTMHYFTTLQDDVTPSPGEIAATVECLKILDIACTLMPAEFHPYRWMFVDDAYHEAQLQWRANNGQMAAVGGEFERSVGPPSTQPPPSAAAAKMASNIESKLRTGGVATGPTPVGYFRPLLLALGAAPVAGEGRGRATSRSTYAAAITDIRRAIPDAASMALSATATAYHWRLFRASSTLGPELSSGRPVNPQSIWAALPEGPRKPIWSIAQRPRPLLTLHDFHFPTLDVRAVARLLSVYASATDLTGVLGQGAFGDDDDRPAEHGGGVSQFDLLDSSESDEGESGGLDDSVGGAADDTGTSSRSSSPLGEALTRPSRHSHAAPRIGGGHGAPLAQATAFGYTAAVPSAAPVFSGLTCLRGTCPPDYEYFAWLLDFEVSHVTRASDLAAAAYMRRPSGSSFASSHGGPADSAAGTTGALSAPPQASGGGASFVNALGGVAA